MHFCSQASTARIRHCRLGSQANRESVVIGTYRFRYVHKQKLVRYSPTCVAAFISLRCRNLGTPIKKAQFVDYYAFLVEVRGIEPLSKEKV